MSSAELDADSVMPIAIIGIAGRFPGDAENPMKLWDMIAEGRSALSSIPKDRFDIDGHYHPDNERHGSINVRKAHFMKRDISAFDAPFFTISVAEAQAMDPQQRMALECTYEALENAGIRMEEVDGSETSCYVGSFTRDYNDMMACDPDDLPLYHSTGTGSAMLSNRVSWFFNMKGPSVSLDTACSSSMVALHLGCQGLRSGETTLSVVGGTNLMLLPDIMGAMGRLNFLSPDGKCHSFDHKANGYSRGEGAAFCILKPLHLALQDGDVIRGVIRNSGVGHDGNTPGITNPSGEAQEALIRRVYAEAGLGLGNTDYVEAHGTGTPAGDPVETGALARTLAASRPRGKPLYIGSIKTNVGHLEGASGLVQVIKAVMMLEKGEIPPLLWFDQANPRIPLEDWNLKLATEPTPWPNQGPRRISINSFGYGGTNSHCIIDDAFHYLKARGLSGNHHVRTFGTISPNSTPDSGVGLATPLNASNQSFTARIDFEKSTVTPTLLLWTANEQDATSRNAKILSDYIASKLQTDESPKVKKMLLRKLSKTLATRRSLLPWRTFAVVNSLEDAVAKLTNVATPPLRVTSNVDIDLKLGFVFTGQGAQWFAMGRELCEYPIFYSSLQAASSYLLGLGSSWSVETELCRDEDSTKVLSPEISQPICTALQVALVDLLQAWGIRPAAVVGHSSGEIAAAYAKGALSRENAWKISYYRGLLCSKIREVSPHMNGAMMATGLGPDEAMSYIQRLSHGTVTVACVNSPSSTTVSGDFAAIEELELLMQADGHFARKLRVGVAYHSSHMHVIAQRYEEALSDVKTEPDGSDCVTMFSSLTGTVITANQELDAKYWVANLVSPVEFSAAVQCMLKHTEELGPAAALKGPIKQILSHQSVVTQAATVTYQSILERGQNACMTALAVVGHLFQLGVPLNLCSIIEKSERFSRDGFLVDIPPYGWNHSLKYWYEGAIGRAHRFRKQMRKDLFGQETADAIPDEPRYRNILRLKEVPWMASHSVQGSYLYPAAGMMVMAIEALAAKADNTKRIKGYELRDIIINKAMVIPTSERGIETILSLKPFRHGSQALTSSWQEFEIFSRVETWELNCAGLIRIEYEPSFKSDVFTHEEGFLATKHADMYKHVRSECLRPQSTREFYNHLESIGLIYKGVFQSLTEVRKGDRQSTCELEIPDTRSIMPRQFEYPHVIHPATLDNIVQMALPASSRIDEELAVAMVPVSIERLFVSADIPSAPATLLQGYSRSEATGFDGGECAVVVSDNTWAKPLVIFEGLKCKRLNDADMDTASATEKSLRKLGTSLYWKEDLDFLSKEKLLELFDEDIGRHLPVTEKQTYIELEIACLIICQRVLRECPKLDSEILDYNLNLFHSYMQHCIDRYRNNELPYQSQCEGIDWLAMTTEEEDQLLQRVSAASADGKALVQHGKFLPKILRCEITAPQVLVDGGFLANFDHSGLGNDAQHAQMSWYIDLMAHKNPNMKILEIGGGAASATVPILQKLGGANGTAPRFSSYTFTDVKTAYLERSTDKLAPWLSYIDFSKLNIEEDPTVQGFEEGQYDLIVASKVLHATQSISKSLGNVRKLLKPSGKLIMSEVTAIGKMRAHMIVGTLDGWWCGEEDGRKYGPTLEVGPWEKALLDAKFNGIEVSFQDAPAPDTGVSVFVSGIPGIDEIPVPKEVLIVTPNISDDDVAQAAIALQDGLIEHCATVTITNLANTMAWDNSDLERKSCICLVDACASGEGFLQKIDQEEWDALKHLILLTGNMTYVTRGGTLNGENPSSNLMTGMARTIRSEHVGLGLTTVDMESHTSLSRRDNIAALIKVFIAASRAANSDQPEWEYAIREGRHMVQRVLLEKGVNDMASTWYSTPKPMQLTFKQSGRPLKLGIGTPGRLDTLQFDDDVVSRRELASDEVEIEVKAIGLNFKDIMVAMGQLTQPALGLECSGVISRIGSNVTGLSPGDEVMTWKLDTFNNFTRAPAAMVQRLPHGMTMVEAASIPMIYCTAYHSLENAARLQKGESILIHGAAGGVGQAAIILAQSMGATVFATVSTDTKKKHLMDTYGIPESNIFNSRDSVHFSQAVLRLTGGRGVDVVLNSLAGEALRASWRVIARFGRFVELGQRDIVGNTGLDMEPFLRNVSFHSVNMTDLLDWDVATAAQGLAKVVELLNNNIIKPVSPINTFPMSRIEEAFRTMQTGAHMGKIVLEAHDDDHVPVLPASAPPVKFLHNATYVISGGGGGLGRFIATWMVKNGARNILLLSRSGDSKAPVRDLKTSLESSGARVGAWACDVGDESAVRGVVERCQRESWPAIRGVIQGAMNLQDAIYENMTLDQFKDSIKPKVNGSWNLHKYMPQDVDFFILLSSTVGVVGSRGQCNYAAGNTYMDALASHRRSKGLAGSALDLGVMLGVGFLAEETTAKVHDNIQSWAFLGIREREFIGILEAAMRNESSSGVPMPPQLILGLGTGGMMAHGKKKYPWWFNDRKFSHLVQIDTQLVSQTGDGDTETPLSVVLANVTDLDQAADAITAKLVNKLAKSLMMSAEDIEPSKSVSNYGVDSLLAVEVRSWLRIEARTEVSVFDLLSNIPISQLALKLAASSKAVPEAVLANKT
ncbi:polyketide synthase [Cordyceps javanica]|nr:polyketide synthase [Cordyceps javanica]